MNDRGYFSQLSGGLRTIVAPQVSTVSPKAVSIALDEINQGRIVPVYWPGGEGASPLVEGV